MESTVGIDGILYELWKTLLQKHNQNEKSNITKSTFNVTKVLTYIFQDIQTHGVGLETDFTLGWMCPIYKKMKGPKSGIIDLLHS